MAVKNEKHFSSICIKFFLYFCNPFFCRIFVLFCFVFGVIFTVLCPAHLTLCHPTPNFGGVFPISPPPLLHHPLPHLRPATTRCDRSWASFDMGSVALPLTLTLKPCPYPYPYPYPYTLILTLTLTLALDTLPRTPYPYPYPNK